MADFKTENVWGSRGYCTSTKHQSGFVDTTYLRNTKLWNIPGGGYNPKKETAGAAALREIHEELGMPLHNLKQIGEYRTEGEGKRDTVLLFSGTAESADNIRPNPEIAEMEWVSIYTLHDRSNDVARVARRAVDKIIEMRS